MSVVIAIDPGDVRSAVVVRGIDGLVHNVGILPNASVLDMLQLSIVPHTRDPLDSTLVIEMIASYGMPVGATIFETCVWIGRFLQAYGGRSDRMFRRDAKMHLCGTPRAKDSNIRQALIDRFGPSKEVAIGTKKKPGPLHGFAKDSWAALAVLVTWIDQHEPEDPV